MLRWYGASDPVTKKYWLFTEPSIGFLEATGPIPLQFLVSLSPNGQ